MGEGLMWISESPARTFWEACQGTIMYQLFLALDSRYPAVAFGRFDQYTWPFLKADLEAGRITMDEAQEIVDAFFLKANCFYSAAPAFIAVTTGIGNTYQHTTIGGINPDTGEDATNPVTFMVLETIGRLALHDPTISLRRMPFKLSVTPRIHTSMSSISSNASLSFPLGGSDAARVRYLASMRR